MQATIFVTYNGTYSRIESLGMTYGTRERVATGGGYRRMMHGQDVRPVTTLFVVVVSSRRRYYPIATALHSRAFEFIAFTTSYRECWIVCLSARLAFESIKAPFSPLGSSDHPPTRYI